MHTGGERDKVPVAGCLLSAAVLLALAALMMVVLRNRGWMDTPPWVFWTNGTTATALMLAWLVVGIRTKTDEDD